MDSTTKCWISRVPSLRLEKLSRDRCFARVLLPWARRAAARLDYCLEAHLVRIEYQDQAQGTLDLSELRSLQVLSTSPVDVSAGFAFMRRCLALRKTQPEGPTDEARHE